MTYFYTFIVVILTGPHGTRPRTGRARPRSRPWVFYYTPVLVFVLAGGIAGGQYYWVLGGFLNII